MKSLSIYASVAMALLPVLSAPALAQSRADQDRWDAAQARYRSETDIFQRERARYESVRGRGGYQGGPGYRDNRYGNNAPPGYDDDRFATDYDAARDYRDDPRYQDRRMSDNDQVYRGSDGRYYCKRNDGTTGLIIGAASGGILGNVIDGGRKRTAGTLIGGALGALAGRSIDQNSDVRCR